VSALLSGVVIKSGIYGLFRLLSWLPSLPAGCGIAMLVVAVASGVLGVLYAIAQHDLKRLLAYHSVENIGIIGLGIGMGMLGQTAAQPVLAVLGYSGALVHVLNHALFKGLLFLSAGTVLHATGTGEIDRLGGLARSMPVNAAMFLVAAVSICGLPPFNGFVSEWILYGSLFGGAIGPVPAAAGPAALGAVALALMGGLALACFAKVFSVVFLGVPRDASIRPHPTAYLMRMGMLLLALPCIVIGLVPAMFVPLTTGGVSVVAGLSTASCHGPLHDILGSLGMLSRMAAILLGLLTGLALLRRTVLRRNRLEDGTAGPTWGCGYARPSPRMQYTASSFAWSLVDAFRYLLWPSREAPATVGCFPPPARLESHTVDVAEHDLFGPLLRGTALLFASVRTVSWPWPSGRPTALPAPGDRVGPLRALLTRLVRVLRRGGIHVCLAFMALTLLIVFVLGSLAGPGSSSSSRPSTTGTSSEVLK
jgi:hydrogenase-4 component B